MCYILRVAATRPCNRLLSSSHDVNKDLNWISREIWPRAGQEPSPRRKALRDWGKFNMQIKSPPCVDLMPFDFISSFISPANSNTRIRFQIGKHTWLWAFNSFQWDIVIDSYTYFFFLIFYHLSLENFFFLPENWLILTNFELKNTNFDPFWPSKPKFDKKLPYLL